MLLQSNCKLSLISNNLLPISNNLSLISNNLSLVPNNLSLIPNNLSLIFIIYGEKNSKADYIPTGDRDFLAGCKISLM